MNMNCGNCGFSLDYGAAYCGNCGFKIILPGQTADPQPSTPPQLTPTSPGPVLLPGQPSTTAPFRAADDKATAALLLGILSIPMSLTLLGGVMGIIAIVMGAMSLKTHKGKAVGAIVCGALGVLCVCGIIFFSVARRV